MSKKLVIAFFSIMGVANAAYADAYTDMVDAEAANIGARSKAAPKGDSGTGAAVDKQQALLNELSANHRGTYALYQKLPSQSKEEVIKAYADGASVDEIRKMIADRTLHR